MSQGLPFDWIISDTHWGHRNINKYSWRTTPAMPTPEAVDELMYFNWEQLVKPDDRIIHLGDLCKWDQGERIERIAGLPGIKTILLGNHDNYPAEWYHDHGFETVVPQRTNFQFRWTDTRKPPPGCDPIEWTVLMSHYPLDMKHHKGSAVNIHGHVHNNPYREASYRHLNMSVEVTHYAPVPLDKVLAKVTY